MELYLHHLIRLRGVILKHIYNFTCTSKESDAHALYIRTSFYTLRKKHENGACDCLIVYWQYFFNAELLTVKRTTSLVHSD